MTFDPLSSSSVVILVPDELRIIGQKASTPDDVLQVMVAALYEPGDATIVPKEDPGMRVAVQKTQIEIGIIAGDAAEEISPLTLQYTQGERTIVKHVRGVTVRPGAVPKIPFVDYKDLAAYGLEAVVAPEPEEAALVQAEAQAERWKTRADTYAEERDAARDKIETLEKQIALLQIEQKTFVRELERFGSEAVVIVPTRGETIVEALRQRVRQLEYLLDRAAVESEVPPEAQAERVSLELANLAMRRALQDVIAAAQEPLRVLGAGALLRWTADRARIGLGEAAARWEPTNGDACRSISRWTSEVASFLAILVQKTGAPHEDGCDCQGCVAAALLVAADAMHIAWKDPLEDVLEEEGGRS